MTSSTAVASVVFVVIFMLTVPVSILIVNMVVVFKVRRAATNAAANLGVQPHHQSTSVVPTVLLIATSLIYVLLCTSASISYLIYWSIDFSREAQYIVEKVRVVAYNLAKLIYAYNFYVYVITGKQFRSDLHQLFCHCLSSCSCSSSADADAAAVNVADDAEIARRVEAETSV